jgi:hypothetical protein
MNCPAVPASGCFFFRSTRISPRVPRRRLAVRRPPASRRLSAQAARRRGSSRKTTLSLQFLLRARRLPEAGDAAVGALPRPQSLPVCGGRAGERHAARAVATPRPRTVAILRRRPTTIARWQVFWQEHVPQHRSGRSRADVCQRWPRPSCRDPFWKRSWAVTIPARDWGRYCDFCRRSRSREACRAHSPDGGQPPAEDARRHRIGPGPRVVTVALHPFSEEL